MSGIVNLFRYAFLCVHDFDQQRNEVVNATSEGNDLLLVTGFQLLNQQRFPLPYSTLGE
jgi:hypothetical protein